MQNRVTPAGDIVANPARGLLMGNRGCLHRADRTLGSARWRSTRWICCTLDWKGVKRDPMPPGRWTALFFLDEATALAAGHRPCAYCRRADFNAFATAWALAHSLGRPPRAGDIDTRLHAERIEPRSKRKLTRPARFGTLPVGAMVQYGGGARLVRPGRLLPWSFSGYGTPMMLEPATEVELLTPPATLATIAAGYPVMVHPTAR